MKSSSHRRLLRYALPHWKSIAAAVAVVFAGSGVELLRPWPTKVLVDNVLGPYSMPRVFAPVMGFVDDPKAAALAVAAGFFLFVALVGGLVNLAETYFSIRLGQKMVLDLRSQLFTHLHKLGLRFHDSRNVGDTTYRLTSDTWAVQTYLIHGMLPMLTSVVSLFAIFFVMLSIDWQLTLLALAVVPVLFLSISRFTQHISALSTKLYEQESELNTVAQQSMSMVRLIKAFVREDQEKLAFDRQNRDSLNAGLRLYTLQTLFSLTVSILSGIGTALVVYVGVNRALAGLITPGEILVFIAYLATLYGPISSISETFGTLEGAMASARRVFEVLDEDPDVVENPKAGCVGSVSGMIEFDNVSFSYSPDAPVLHGVSFSAVPGETVAVVGSTGAGKSTLVSLAPRFYDPDSGRVLLDGTDLRDLKIRDLREQVSLVLQEAVLFPTSIYENIVCGRPGATEAEVVGAAKAANAHDFILGLPGGYSSEVGERGVRLSGGERQRISIARAFLKDAPILILDEPTSSLDSNTEAAIIEALERLMSGKTTLLVTHRLSTMRFADRVIVLQQGRLVESGSHEELWEAGGVYKKLFERQVSRGGK